MTERKLAALAALAASLSVTPAGAQEVYKIGISAGLTGYAAKVDRGWRDGVEVAAATLNAKGGIMGRKIEVVTEDNKSEPQEAVTVYRKMISSDKADIFLSGCVSAGCVTTGSVETGGAGAAGAGCVDGAGTPLITEPGPSRPTIASASAHTMKSAPSTAEPLASTVAPCRAPNAP